MREPRVGDLCLRCNERVRRQKFDTSVLDDALTTSGSQLVCGCFDGPLVEPDD